MIRVPMDLELYNAAVDVMDEIDRKLTHASRGKLSDEEVLGRNLAQAYRRWQALLISKYASSDEPDPEVEAEVEEKLDGRRHNRPASPPRRNHPWRGKAVKSKT